MKSNALIKASMMTLVFQSIVAAVKAEAISGLYNIGVNASGTPLQIDKTDTHYLVNGTTSPVVCANGAYNTPSTAQSLSMFDGGGCAVNPNTYTLVHDIGDLNSASAQLSGAFEADNYGTVYLNVHMLVR